MTTMREGKSFSVLMVPEGIDYQGTGNIDLSICLVTEYIKLGSCETALISIETANPPLPASFSIQEVLRLLQISSLRV